MVRSLVMKTKGDSGIRARELAEKYHVFLSHSTRSDSRLRETVDDLASVLQSNGLSVFIDRQSVEKDIDLSVALEEAIRRSAVGVLVMTQRALASRWVAREIDAMVDQVVAGKMRVVWLGVESGCRKPEGLPMLEEIEPLCPQNLRVLAERIIRLVRAGN